ncbi:MAG: Flp family type IVb pilin [Deltaproteobacteria bacterium]|jgi:pilus assembly protein Flp/PilA|nr:Flp family type IVb pilin [Deltaproteobacteria bacterium]
MERLRQFLKNENGVTAIEYALVATLIAVAIVGAVTLLGTSVTTNYENIQTEISNAQIIN